MRYLREGCCWRRKLPVITFFSVLGEIETLNFMVFRHAQPHDHIDGFQNRECSHNSQRSRYANSNGLIHELMCVPFQRAGSKHASPGIFKDRIHRAAGEHASEQRAQSAPCAVNPKGVERVIITKARLDVRDHEITEDASDCANAK